MNDDAVVGGVSIAINFRVFNNIDCILLVAMTTPLKMDCRRRGKKYMAEVCRWTSLETFIYCKLLLKGCTIFYSRWQRISFLDVHRQLAAHINQAERWNLYQMKKLATQGLVQDDSLVDYIISGEVNKTVLYGATNIAEFKR